MTTVRRAFYEVCRSLGLTTIFGNPGSTEETMLRSFPDDFRYVLALQEASAVAMADAYAQRTSRVALVNLHTAAGVANSLASIETAFCNRAPLVIVAGQQTREMLLHEPYLTNSSPTSIAAPFVKWAYETVQATDVPAALFRAHAVAVQSPPGPVFLSIPMDDFEKPFEGDLPPRNVEPSIGADIAKLMPIVIALQDAQAPGLVMGGAVDQGGGWEDGVRLAELLKAKIWAAPGEGRPGFPETHRFYQGTLPAGIKPASEALEGCDVVVVIGAPVFRYYPYAPGPLLPKGARLFQITDDSKDAAAAWIGHSVLADPARACAVLAEALTLSTRADPDGMDDLKEPVPSRPITAGFLYASISKARGPDGVIVQESLSTLKELRQRLPTSKSASFFSMTSGVLGYGLPAAVGVALAENDLGSNRKLIAIIGDGSANYTIQALWTAAQLKSDILFVVVANGAYDILKSFGAFLGTSGVPGLDVPGLDFVALAKGYGLSAERVEDPDQLVGVLERSLSRFGPHLIEVTVDASTPALL